jgi:hypothetical protein
MNSPLSICGAISTSIITTNNNINLDISHYTVLCNPTSVILTVALPLNNTGVTGRMYKIKNIGVQNVVISGFGSLIDSNSSYTLIYSPSVMNYVTIQSDGTNWWIVG